MLLRLLLGVKLRYATLAPLESPTISYTQNNNLFIYRLADNTTTQVTQDGVEGQVLYGVCDWVYEEEIYEQTKAQWWSPKGNFLAFLRFDETFVPTYTYSNYDIPNNKEYHYKYPKPGQNNSFVTVGT